MASQARIPTLDFLRGFASLAVAWYHFTGWPSVHPILKASGTYGWVGVEAFFVISGFVIPYALSRSHYSLVSYGRFVLKRIVRLDPPYMASIVFIVVLGYISPLMPGFKGESFHISPAALVSHLGYANVLFGYPWLNVVYWTLAIEFQYYLLVGLLFPAISSESQTSLYVIVTMAALLSWMSSSTSYILHFLPIFVMGILTFRYKTDLTKRGEYLVSLFAMFAAAAFTLGIVIASVGFATGLLIGFAHFDNGVFRFFGAISYSLYLLHVPIGMKIGNLAGRLPNAFPAQVVAPFVALFFSILAAYLLYKTVELPAQQWSSSIRYRKQRSQTVGTASLETPALGETLR